MTAMVLKGVMMFLHKKLIIIELLRKKEIANIIKVKEVRTNNKT